MKTKLTLLVGILALAGMSYAGPGESAAFAARNARENAAVTHMPAQAATNDGGSFIYAPAPSGKGLVQVPNRDESMTNIALFKSSKKKACCAKR